MNPILFLSGIVVGFVVGNNIDCHHTRKRLDEARKKLLHMIQQKESDMKDVELLKLKLKEKLKIPTFSNEDKYVTYTDDWTNV